MYQIIIIIIIIIIMIMSLFSEDDILSNLYLPYMVLYIIKYTIQTFKTIYNRNIKLDENEKHV